MGENDPDNFGIDPAAVYRWQLHKKLFGLEHSQLSDAIKAGKIPAPFAIVEGGIAKAWTGTQIIEHRRARIAASRKPHEKT